jgi:hypothetical protein
MIKLSRRERMTYIGLILILGFGIFAMYRGCSLLDATAFTSPLIGMLGWYLKLETDRKSEL